MNDQKETKETNEMSEPNELNETNNTDETMQASETCPSCCASTVIASGEDIADTHKSKIRSEEEIKKLDNRLKRIEGQIRGIRNMLAQGRYCTDILVQSAAVSAAMNAFNREVLANHIRTCVYDDIRDGDPARADESVEELVKLTEKLMK